MTQVSLNTTDLVFSVIDRCQNDGVGFIGDRFNRWFCQVLWDLVHAKTTLGQLEARNRLAMESGDVLSPHQHTLWMFQGIGDPQ